MYIYIYILSEFILNFFRKVFFFIFFFRVAFTIIILKNYLESLKYISKKDKKKGKREIYIQNNKLFILIIIYNV